MKVTLKQFFNLGDGRLSTEIGDVYKMLNYIFDENFMTHQLPTAIRELQKQNPIWYSEGVMKLDFIKKINETNDFLELMEIIDSFHKDYEIDIGKLKANIPFSAGLI